MHYMVSFLLTYSLILLAVRNTGIGKKRILGAISLRQSEANNLFGHSFSDFLEHKFGKTCNRDEIYL